jgi:hypothetical protein
VLLPCPLCLRRSISGTLSILYCIIVSLHYLGVLSLEFSVSFPQCLLESFSRKSRITISSVANDQKVLPIFYLIEVSMLLKREVVLLSRSFMLLPVKRRVECPKVLARTGYWNVLFCGQVILLHCSP